VFKSGSLLRELVVAAIAVVSLDVLVAFLYWLATGHALWLLILGQGAAFGPAVALVALTSPRN
jgi:hypothetical protein